MKLSVFYFIVSSFFFFSFSNSGEVKNDSPNHDSWFYYYKSTKYELTINPNRIAIKKDNSRNIDIKNRESLKNIQYQYEAFGFEIFETSQNFHDLIESSKGYYSFISPVFESENGKTKIFDNKLYVKFHDSVDVKTVLDLLKTVGVEIIQTKKYFKNILRVDLAGTAYDLINSVQKLYNSKKFEEVVPSFIFEVEVDNPGYPDQWYISNNSSQSYTPGTCTNNGNNLNPSIDINVEDVWNSLNIDGQNVKIAIFDTGVDKNHEDLQGNILNGFDAIWAADPLLGSLYGGPTSGNPQLDNNQISIPCTNTGSTINGNLYNYHGTACAGIIAMEDNSDGGKGIAYKSRIIPIRMITRQNIGKTYPCIPTGSECSQLMYSSGTVIMEATLYAADQGAQIISNSTSLDYDATIEIAITAFLEDGRNGLGGIFISSAGNYNKTEVSFPSAIPDAISVGAASLNGDRKSSTSLDQDCELNCLASYDITGGVSIDGEGSWGSNYGYELDIMAPGVFIYTTFPENRYMDGGVFRYFSGTSAACPIVAGVAALILEANPNLSKEQLSYALLHFAKKQNPSKYDYVSGYGHPYGSWNNGMGYGFVDAMHL
ncbi:MAG: S8 family serine peptidase [Saprospiraceae bacterium]